MFAGLSERLLSHFINPELGETPPPFLLLLLAQPRPGDLPNSAIHMQRAGPIHPQRPGALTPRRGCAFGRADNRGARGERGKAPGTGAPGWDPARGSAGPLGAGGARRQPGGAAGAGGTRSPSVGSPSRRALPGCPGHQLPGPLAAAR